MLRRFDNDLLLDANRRISHTSLRPACQSSSPHQMRLRLAEDLKAETARISALMVGR